MRFLLACLCAAPLVLTAPAYADATYLYASPAYSTAVGPYTTTEAASGTFSFQGILAPGLNGSTLTPLSSYSFSDGVENFVSNDADTVNYFTPNTDASGDLTSFFLELVTSLPNSSPSDLYTNNLIITYGPAYAGTIQTFAFQDRGGQLAGFAETSSDGTLTPIGISTTPEPSSITLLATGVLGLAGVLRKRLG